MAPQPKHRKAVVVALAASLFILLLLFSALQALNLPFLQPHSAGLVLLFTGLSFLAFTDLRGAAGAAVAQHPEALC